MTDSPTPAPTNNSGLYGRAIALHRCFVQGMDRLWCPVALAIRIHMGWIFFSSGLTKLDNWDITVSLFADEYQVPLFPPELAACLATAVELSMPVLLFAGLATRLATLPLIGMTLMIQFITLCPEYFDFCREIDYLNANEHWYWLLLFLALLTRGAGRISLDHLWERWVRATP